VCAWTWVLMACDLPVCEYREQPLCSSSLCQIAVSFLYVDRSEKIILPEYEFLSHILQGES
jgi:hypothetical protein